MAILSFKPSDLGLEDTDAKSTPRHAKNDPTNFGEDPVRNNQNRLHWVWFPNTTFSSKKRQFSIKQKNEKKKQQQTNKQNKQKQEHKEKKKKRKMRNSGPNYCPIRP